MALPKIQIALLIYSKWNSHEICHVGREFAPLLKILAAIRAVVDVLNFYPGRDDLELSEAMDRLDELVPAGKALHMHSVLSRIEEIGYFWGLGRKWSD